MTRHCRCSYLADDCRSLGVCRYRGREIHCGHCHREVTPEDELHERGGDELCAGCTLVWDLEGGTVPCPEMGEVA